MSLQSVRAPLNSSRPIAGPRKRYLLLVLVPLACVLTFAFYRVPGEASLVGTYVLESDLAEYRDHGASLVLNPDGTCYLRNMPDSWTSMAGRWDGGVDSASGTWKTDDDPGVGRCVRVRLSPDGDYSPATRRHHEGGLKYGIDYPFAIAGLWPPYALRVWLGDPDEGRTLRFVKR